jgi:8-oxo-dGTP diphosphatase
MEFHDPIPVCCVLIEHDGRVLIAQRPPGKHLALEWEFPGGKIEAGESPADALHREIEEELGCKLILVRALPTVFHAYPKATVALHPFVASLAPDSPSPEPKEHVALRWLEPDQLASAALAPADVPVLASYFHTRSHG